MRRSIWLIIPILLLSSCLAPQANSTPTPNAQAVFTSVQLTVDANQTSLVVLTPSATITPTITETSVSTSAAATTVAPSITSTLIATQSSLADKAELTNQSPADQSKVNAGASFTVTWTFKNTGTTTWTTDYTANFWSDDLMGSPNIIHFSKEVKPNDTIDITMNFKAPSTTGADKSSWWLQNAQGVNFFPFFVAIQVVSAPPTATATVAPTHTLTPAPTDTATITVTPTQTDTTHP